MLSETAKSSFDNVFRDSILNTCSGDRPVSVTEIEKTEVEDAYDLLAITLSMTELKILCIMYIGVPEDAEENKDNMSFSNSDHLYELLNTVGGKLKAYLLQYFPLIGISTPNWLHFNDFSYENHIDDEFRKHYSVDLDSSSFILSFYLAPYETVDFEYSGETEEDTGGLIEFL